MRDVLGSHALIGGSRRVSTVDLLEPPKADVLRGAVGPRKAFVVLYDAARNATSEAVVNVDERTLESTHDVPGVEPRLDGVDADAADAITRANDAWRRALARRGLSPNDVAVMAWTAGNFGQGDEDPSRGRLVRALTVVRAASANEFSRPVEGLVVLVDVAGRRVLDVQDAGDVPPPSAASERDAWQPLARPTTHSPRASTRDESAARSAGIDVAGHAVTWGRWRLHAAVRPREGLVLYGVGFDDGTAVRGILYRASLSEMVVPYGDPSAAWYFRNTFDVGELGVGTAVSILAPGVDCPAGSNFIDAAFAEASGSPRHVPRAIAVYERDGGIAWKHAGAGARARELVVFSESRLGNYDYGFEWVFREDGTITHRVLLTGVMASKAAASPDSVAEQVAHGVAAVNHQHFFNYRLDLDVDGASPNRVEELEARPLGATVNRQAGGFASHERTWSTERDATGRQRQQLAGRLASHQCRHAQRFRTANRLRAGSRPDRRLVGRLVEPAPPSSGFSRYAAVGYAAGGLGALVGGRLPESIARGRRAHSVDAGRTIRAGYRRRALVHRRRDAHAATGRLAGDAGAERRVQFGAGGLLQ